MADDVNVKHIDDLIEFSQKMLSFNESLLSNSKAVSILMVQKLQQLEQMKLRAKSRYEAIEMEYIKFSNYYASVAGRNDLDNRGELLSKLNELSERRRKAALYLNEINTKVCVAKNAVLQIDEHTKRFREKANNLVDNGCRFVKNSVVQLQQYKDLSKGL